jgi:hypothetical protein
VSDFDIVNTYLHSPLTRAPVALFLLQKPWSIGIVPWWNALTGKRRQPCARKAGKAGTPSDS